jgi:hypothetical protein
MKKIYTGNEGYAFVYQADDGTMYLVAICAGLLWRQVGIIMSPEERAAYLADPSSIDAIARSMCYDFEPFRNRAVPENLRSQMKG